MRIPPLIELSFLLGVISVAGAAVAEPRIELGVYRADTAHSVYRWFELSSQLLPTPDRKRHVERRSYRATRHDGTAESGEWSATLYGNGDGYLVFEATAPSKSKTQFAVYRVAQACSLDTRSTAGPRWTAEPIQRYKRDGCLGTPIPSTGDPAIVLMGRYRAKAADSAFSSFELTPEHARSAHPMPGMTYRRYRALRPDGTRETGVYSAVRDSKNDGYLMFERDGGSGTTLQLAVYGIGPTCTLATRPTDVPRWTARPIQPYERDGCSP